jgi:hypothetical protein
MPAGAFAWYATPDRSTTFRISFRVDTSQLDETSIVDGVEILAITSRNPVSAAYGNVLLHVGFVGGGPDASSPYMTFVAYCGSCDGLTRFAVYPIPISDGDLLRFEMGIGADADGWVRYWRNADFSDPPTYALENLDNDALLGPRDVALGAFDLAPRLASVGTALRFSNIETSDEIIFWSYFDD